MNNVETAKKDTLGRQVTRNGVPMKYLLDSLKKDTNDCILWNHAKVDDGYGKIIIDGKKHLVHRLALIMTEGEGGPMALHSCMNKNCFNPRHLRWGSAKDNIEDSRKDKTLAIGSRVGSSKLKESQIPDILADNRSLRKIAKDYGVDHKTICRIKLGRGWTHVGATL